MSTEQKRVFEEFMRAVMNSKEADEAHNRTVKLLYELHGKTYPEKALVEFDINNPPKPLSEVVSEIVDNFKMEKSN